MNTSVIIIVEELQLVERLILLHDCERTLIV